MHDELHRDYQRLLKRSRTISREEERLLFQKSRAGDRLALNSIVQANLRFVVSVANKYKGRGMDLEDLIAEGNMGLLIAAKKFDTTRGLKFISYAVWWIKQSIERALGENLIITTPADVAQKLRMARKVLGKEFFFEDLVDKMGMSESIADRVMQASKLDTLVSLDNPVSAAGSKDGISLYDLIPDSSNQTDSSVIHFFNKKEVQGILESLSKRDRLILEDTFLTQGDAPTLEEIGKKLSMSKERVRQIRTNILKKVREGTKADKRFTRISVLS